jgi:tetraacyldisaccharide 4'-kinase
MAPVSFLRPPAFWYGPRGTPARLLAPLARLYGERVISRMHKQGLRAEIPVLCVGNFTLGGAGKTPLAMALAELLAQADETPVFLTRGYGGRERGPVIVGPDDDSRRVGDEALLLAAQATTIVSRDRFAGAALAKSAGASIVVMDDGFQNPTLAKDCSIIAVDGETGIGNGLTFPAGPLRAALHAQMPFASAVVVIGPGDAGSRVWEFARGSSLAVFRARIGPDATAPALRGQRVLAFAGIGRPQKFFKTLADLGAVIAASEVFADHHPFTGADAIRIATRAQAAKLMPVTTAKDLMRLTGGPARDALASMTRVVPVRLTFEEEPEMLAFLRKILNLKPRS